MTGVLIQNKVCTHPDLWLRLMTFRTASAAAVYFLTAVVFLKFLVEVTILPV